MSLSPARPRGRPLLYRLPAAPLSSVAWRCASSVRLSQLSTSMIDIAKQAGAVRELIKMFELRSKDAVDEAQQTLDYFGVDDAAVKSIREQMDREASTQPLVRLQKLSWVMGAHGKASGGVPLGDAGFGLGPTVRLAAPCVYCGGQCGETGTRLLQHQRQRRPRSTLIHTISS
jgi:hypothetical protein